MDKRSFNFMFTVVVASMVLIGTYRLAKKKSSAAKVVTSVRKANKY